MVSNPEIFEIERRDKIAYENYNCKGYFGFVISFILPSILRADKKAEVIKAAWNGTMDGRKKKVEEWKAS